MDSNPTKRVRRLAAITALLLVVGMGVAATPTSAEAADSIKESAPVDTPDTYVATPCTVSWNITNPWNGEVSVTTDCI